MTENPQPSTAKRYLAMILAGGIAGVVVGLAGVYGIATLTGNAGGDTASNVTCRPAVELAKKLAPLARGEVAAVNVAKSPLKLPDLSFQDASGKPLTLAHWRGRTVLLNLWATWCVPCRKEMPTLDALQEQAGRPRLRGGGGQYRYPRSGKAEGFSERNWHREARLLRRSGCQDLPGLEGRSAAPSACRRPCWWTRTVARLGTIAGPAEWASDDAVKLIQAALGKS